MHDFFAAAVSPLYPTGLYPLPMTPVPPYVWVLIPVIAVLIVWTLIIKGIALWHAARNGQKKWFIALLVLNTLGILELIYLYKFRPSPNASSTVSSETEQ